MCRFISFFHRPDADGKPEVGKRRPVKHVISFSGGASSAYCAWLVLQKQKPEDIILLYADTGAEHKDADRFRAEVAGFLGLPITTISCGFSLWELIDKKKMIPSRFIPFCTTELKIRPMEKYYKGLQADGYDVIVYLGYGADEWRRIQKRQARLLQASVQSAYPCFDCGKSNDEIKSIIRDEWKIVLPITYRHLKHNNCIPCFKATKRDFMQYLKYYPEYMERAISKEKDTGYTIFQDMSLEELRLRVITQGELFCEEDSAVPCECVE